ncbi:3-isopropylmalate dehydratase [Candidatus Sumerlaeota bacterium]|nr:3-isopropylmalate dehydratase [Candidatus Sumerlaeota bacterium]
MQEIVRGRAFVLGDDVDTDQIVPACHLVYSLTDPTEKRLYGKYALSGVPMDQSGLPQGGIPFVHEGSDTSEYSIVVGGKNFGCGSSREHAPFALRQAGVEAVVAEFYARIFFRNSVNGGYLIPYETPQRLVERIKTGDEVEISMAENSLLNLTTGESFALRPLGDIRPILEAGDVFAYARQQNMIK